MQLDYIIWSVSMKKGKLSAATIYHPEIFAPAPNAADYDCKSEMVLLVTSTAFKRSDK